jgi:hypothetical protein
VSGRQERQRRGPLLPLLLLLAVLRADRRVTVASTSLLLLLHPHTRRYVSTTSMSPNATNYQWASSMPGGDVVSVSFFGPPLSNGTVTFPLTFYISVFAYGGHTS